MASMGGGQLDPEPLVRLVKNSGMLNRTLQSICSSDGLNRNGVKAELQQRIIDSTSRGEPTAESLSPSCSHVFQHNIFAKLISFHFQEFGIMRGAGTS
jgi:hypothetical protein